MRLPSHLDVHYSAYHPYLGSIFRATFSSCTFLVSILLIVDLRMLVILYPFYFGSLIVSFFIKQGNSSKKRKEVSHCGCPTFSQVLELTSSRGWFYQETQSPLVLPVRFSGYLQSVSL